MMEREDYGRVNPLVWIIGAILVGAAIYWFLGGFVS